MATQVKIKRGTTNANAPSGLTAGEMAINLVDKKLYVGGTAGTNAIFLDSTAVAGLSTANTFTQLQTFSAGISASGGVTFASDITINSMTVGRGGNSNFYNVAVGSDVLSSNLQGNYNVAVGNNTLKLSTDAVSNVAVGYNALSSCTSSTENVAIGVEAFGGATMGNSNVGVGKSALQSNSGTLNVGVGLGALYWNNGDGNVGVGTSALSYNYGDGNVGVGPNALTTPGANDNNVAVGSASLQSVEGANNTGIGAESGYFIGTANNAIYIGYRARGSGNTQTNEIVIGVDALGLGSNTAVIGATLQSAATIYGVLNLPSGLSASGATFSGNISAPNIVSSFNGATGAVTGASLGANTFTALNSFNAGISASGATFTSDIRIVNSNALSVLTVGFGGGNVYNNIAFGSAALANNTLGSSNVAIGGEALASNTEGSGNIAIGGALLYNTTGSRNIAIGSALYWSTSSDDNIAIGANVMASAPGYVPGSYNVGIGTDALRSGGFTGESNVAIGYAAAKENTTSSHNVAIGFDSLRNNSTGLYNTSVGSGALRHGNSITVQIGGSQMTALGYGAGRYRGTGTSALTTGTGGIFIGYQARASALAQTNEIVIGVDALGLGSNTAVIGATLQSAATIYGVLNLPSGLSASGATFNGNISAPNIVNSFNGLTGGVTGITAGGTNTFTALNIFSAGISASGATLSGTVITSEKVNAITSARTVTVNFQNGNIQTLTGISSGVTGSSAIGFTGASATGSSTVTMIITNGGLMTSNTTFWSTAVKWPGGFKTTLSTSGVDILTFTTIDAGTTIYGMLGGKAFS